MGVTPKIGRLTIYGGELTGMCKFRQKLCFMMPSIKI